MGQLTEVEIFDCLKSNLRIAAQCCDKLAVSHRKGPTYNKLREALKLVEGACRQAAFWRGGDARWLRIGLFVAEAHKRSGDWLRGLKTADGKRIPIAQNELHPLFVQLAKHLRAAHEKADEFRNKRTNRIGPILPVVLPGPHRDTRPVGYTRSSGGILMPNEAAVQ